MMSIDNPASLSRILSAYGIDIRSSHVEPLGSGLINLTWKISAGSSTYVLQRVNDNVFKNPPDIATNISFLAEYLRAHHPEYFFVSPLTALDGTELVFLEKEGYFRLFPHVNDSHTIDYVKSKDQAFQASRQFGLFTKVLSGLALENLRVTIPGFHDLQVYYNRFTAAIKSGNSERIRESESLINYLSDQSNILDTFAKIRVHRDFVQRVTHHDTKISNVLFDSEGRALCVIDLDTVMPGYFISDVGDMMRTYLSPVDENEKDLSKIELIDERFAGIVEGYLGEMNDLLTPFEKDHFFYAGQFIVYMQALRFLTDYILNDPYYQIRYPDHNLVRARNQIRLLTRLNEKERDYKNLVARF